MTEQQHYGEHKKEHGEKPERKPTVLRTANGVVAAILCFLFAAHMLLGSVKFAYPAFDGKLVWVVWIGVGVLAVHVLMSVGTTVAMLRDTERPPSTKKKRHQLMKWVTGCMLLLAAGLHVAYMTGAFGVADPIALNVASFVLVLCVVAAVAWHEFVASKSLLKDLHVPNHKRYRPALRWTLMALCSVAAVALVVAFLL